MTARPPRSFLVAVDDSDGSRHALQFACENIINDDDRVTILHVRPQIEEVDYYAAQTYRQEFEERYLRDSRKLLANFAHLASTYKPSFKSEWTTMSACGDARERIAEAVHDMQPDALVVGSHGHNRFARVLLGSVSDHLIHSAECPVLLVPAPRTSASLPLPGLSQLGRVVASAH